MSLVISSSNKITSAGTRDRFVLPDFIIRGKLSVAFFAPQVRDVYSFAQPSRGSVWPRVVIETLIVEEIATLATRLLDHSARHPLPLGTEFLCKAIANVEQTRSVFKRALTRIKQPRYIATMRSKLTLAVLLILVAASLQLAGQRRRKNQVVSLVPVGTDLKVRLNKTLSSDSSNIGDQFTMTVILPQNFEAASLHGHIGSIRKSAGLTSMTLAFDSIELRDGRRSALSGQVTRVYGIDLIVGGAGGAGSLAVRGGKSLKIESGTEMLVHVTR